MASVTSHDDKDVDEYIFRDVARNIKPLWKVVQIVRKTWVLSSFSVSLCLSVSLSLCLSLCVCLCLCVLTVVVVIMVVVVVVVEGGDEEGGRGEKRGERLIEPSGC